MEIRLAKTAGFCFGVERAVNTVLGLTSGDCLPVYTFGPIIHNESVVKDLESRGVRILNSEEEIDGVSQGTIVIRSHGVSRAVNDRMRKRETESGGRVRIVDATCPFVKKIHKIAEQESRAGKQIIICGDASHPEVQGIMGWCVTPAIVIASVEDAERIAGTLPKSVCIVSQTTFHYKKFNSIIAFFENLGYDRNDSVVNTICNATEERQTEARRLAQECDAMVVIGSESSSNTRKLYEICRQECASTYYVQSACDLVFAAFPSFRCVGITAGASTPRNIIEEVQNRMAEENFGQMLDETFKTIHNGEVVEGTVIRVKEDEIALNIGYKADGILSKSEYSNQPIADLREVVKEGDKIAVKVLKVNDGEGQVLLSRKKLAQDRSSQVLQDAFENKTVVTAKVSEVVKGGITAVVDECRVFIPASLVSDTFEKDLTKFQGQEISFLITDYDPKKRSIIGNRRVLLTEQKKAAMEEALSRIQVGDVVEGVVKNVTDFGAFIDIGGIDGLLHISEMSWGRVGNPKKHYKTGDTVRVYIKDIKNDKIALSAKFADENPWANAEERFAPGTIVTGKVARMTDFGAFVEIYPGVDALLHVSQISRKRVEKPSDALSIGQEIEATILDLRPEEQKISISMRALEEEPEEEIVATDDAAPAEETSEASEEAAQADAE
ncbi:MAG: bifunctional 4-hydroxy-3-methylbut-2-enyl diphosphate reductase/30S ribosomal protein S1 [Lachnospiraceae bacterium]|nr:bifunctional 4-hydroxy-3-methylbut-2-enyl diphosphate reductase/30S ribosomal protein S1 [Lachnospiraceae bacterium]